MTFQPSPQQQLIFTAIEAGDHNILVDAKAGSGKTTTIVHGMKYIPRDMIMPSTVFLAFNKQIAETLKTRCPSGVLCSTFHALGFRALKESQILEQRVKVDSGKCRWILYDLLNKDNEDFRNILRLVSLLKGGQEVSFEDIDIRDLIAFHNLDFQEPDKAIHLAIMVLRKSNEQLNIIDFDDMLHLAVLMNARFEPRDWIFVDEAQDLNGIQHEIVARLCKRGREENSSEYSSVSASVDADASRSSTRVIAVGDPHQAIYGFRGALADSMSRLAHQFSMRTYPLSVSYRCPKAVVREAQKYLIS